MRTLFLVAVIESLKQQVVSGIGMLYNFSHGHADVVKGSVLEKRQFWPGKTNGVDVTDFSPTVTRPEVPS